MTTIRPKYVISKAQTLAITTVAPSTNHSPVHDLEITPRKHAISDEVNVSRLQVHPIHHFLSVPQSLDPEPEAVSLARPTARSLQTVSDACGAKVLAGSGPISLRHSDVSGLTDLLRRSLPRKATEHSFKIKTSFQHSVDTSPFCTPQPFAITAPPVFSVAVQSVTVSAPEADTAESTSANAKEQHSSKCGNAEAHLMNADAAQDDSSFVFEEAVSDWFLSSDAERIEPDRLHSSGSNKAERSADETDRPIFVPISVHPLRRRERVASVEGDIPEEDNEDVEDSEEDEISEASPYRPTTKPKDIPKLWQPSLHANARIDSDNVPDADMALSTSTGPLSGLQLMSPVFNSRSSSVFANSPYKDSYVNANRRHSQEITPICTDETERTRYQLTQCDSAASRQLTGSVSRPRELLQVPELPRMGRRRSETVPPANAPQMPPAVANGLGFALVCPSSPTFRQMWAQLPKHPGALSYSVPPTPHHVRSESDLDNDFFSDSLNGPSGEADGRTSAPPFGQPQSPQSSVFDEAASGRRSRDQLGEEVSSERDLASPPLRKSIFSSMISVADTIDSSSSSSAFRLSRHFSFNVKHTGPGNASLPPQVQQHHRNSVCIPLENNQFKQK